MKKRNRQNKILGPLSDYINDIIGKYWKTNSDTEISKALNSSVALTEAGVSTTRNSITIRRNCMSLVKKTNANQYSQTPEIKPLTMTYAEVEKQYSKDPSVKKSIKNPKPKKPNTLSKRVFQQWLEEQVIRLLGLKRQHASMNTLLNRLRSDVTKSGILNSPEEVSRVDVFKILDKVYWKPIGKKHIDDALHARFSPEKLKSILDKNTPGLDIPLWVVEEKLKAARGYIHAPRRDDLKIPRGVLRVDITDSDVSRIPTPSMYDTPVIINPDKHGDAKIAILSGPQVGLPYDVVMERNLIRCAFSTAEKDKCTHMVIGGGLMRLVLMQAGGPYKILRDLLSASELDPESYSILYRETARKILDSNTLLPVYTTATEMFEEYLRGWYRIVRTKSPGPDGNEKPEFSGKVLIILSPSDIEDAARMAWFHMLFEMKKNQREASSEMRWWDGIQKQLHKALIETQRAADAPETEAKLQAQLESAEIEYERAADLENRARATNFDPSQNKKVLNAALAYLIERIEDVIPNSKVIGLNNAFVKIGDSGDIIHFTSGNTVSAFAEVVNNYGHAQRRQEIARHTCVMNSVSAYYKMVTREDYRSGTMSGTVHFYESPLLVDSKRILESAGGMRVPDKVMKAVRNSAHQAGMLVVKSSRERGLENPNFYSSDTIRARGHSSSTKKTVEYIWKLIMTDMHYASNNRVRIYTPEGVPIGIPEAVMRMLRKSGIDKNGTVPFATFESLDDLMQGEHFGNYKRPHPEVISTPLILKEAEAILKKTKSKPRSAEAMKSLQNEILKLTNQLWIRPPNNLTMQWPELVLDFVKPNIDILAATIRRAQHGGVRILGVSHFRKQEYNMMDAGIIVFGSGNHMAKTTDFMFHEGPVMADRIIAELGKFNEWSYEKLCTLVKGPLSSDQTISYGILFDSKGYKWGLEYCSSPPKRMGWTDILAGTVVRNKKVGNASTILARPEVDITIYEYGDKHFCASSITNDGIIVMGPSSTHTDSFAYTAGGLPENSNGVAFLGLPIGGPDKGPIRFEHVTSKMIQEYIGKNKPFPWLDLLIHPVGGWKS